MALDTIKELLAKSGVKPEIASQICESMEEYKVKVNADAQKSIANKVKLAKQVVLEEVETYKLDLARKVQLFCESKSQTIEQQLTRKSAASETEATQKLTGVKALLEGVELGAKPNGQLTAQLADAQGKISRLNKQVKAASTQVERSARIAESAMEKNKKLIQENRELRSGVQVVQESKETRPAGRKIQVPARKTATAQQVVTESVQKNKQVITESVKKIVDPIADIAARMK